VELLRSFVVVVEDEMELILVLVLELVLVLLLLLLLVLLELLELLELLLRSELVSALVRGRDLESLQMDCASWRLTLMGQVAHLRFLE
jgi:hypothetical protein